MTKVIDLEEHRRARAAVVEDDELAGAEPDPPPVRDDGDESDDAEPREERDDGEDFEPVGTRRLFSSTSTLKQDCKRVGDLYERFSRERIAHARGEVHGYAGRPLSPRQANAVRLLEKRKDAPALSLLEWADLLGFEAPTEDSRRSQASQLFATLRELGIVEYGRGVTLRLRPRTDLEAAAAAASPLSPPADHATTTATSAPVRLKSRDGHGAGVASRAAVENRPAPIRGPREIGTSSRAEARAADDAPSCPKDRRAAGRAQSAAPSSGALSGRVFVAPASGPAELRESKTMASNEHTGGYAAVLGYIAQKGAASRRDVHRTGLLGSLGAVDTCLWSLKKSGKIVRGEDKRYRIASAPPAAKPAPPPPPPPKPAAAPSPSRRTTRDAIVAFVRERGMATTDDVHRAKISASRDGAKQALKNLVRDGLLERVDAGVFAPAKKEPAPSDALRDAADSATLAMAQADAVMARVASAAVDRVLPIDASETVPAPVAVREALDRDLEALTTKMKERQAKNHDVIAECEAAVLTLRRENKAIEAFLEELAS